MIHIKELIDNNNTDKAIQLLYQIISQDKSCDEAFFLLGNAYCKKNAWQEALNAYCQAIDINPHSPATTAYEHIQEILSFFNKDLYNP